MRFLLFFFFLIKVAFATAPNYGNIMEFECEEPSQNCSIWVSYNVAYQYSGDNKPKLLESKMYNLRLKEKTDVTASFYTDTGLVYDFKRSDGVEFEGPRVFEDIYLEVMKGWNPPVAADSMGDVSQGIKVNKVDEAPVLTFAILGVAPLDRVYIISSDLGYILRFGTEDRHFFILPDGCYSVELLYMGTQYGRQFYARSGKFANFDVKDSRITRFSSGDGVKVLEVPDNQMVLLMNGALKQLKEGADFTF